MRKFIQGLFPEKLPCLGDPRIVLQFLVDFVFFANGGILRHHLFEDLLGTGNHGAVFVHFEQPPVAPDAFLDKENRIPVPMPAVGDPDIERQRNQHQHAGDRGNDIRDAFGRKLEIRVAGPGRRNEQGAVEVVDLRCEVDLPVNAGHEVDIRDQVIGFAEDALHVGFPQVGNRDQDRVNVMIRHGFFELLPRIHLSRELFLRFLHHMKRRIRGAVHESQGIHEGEPVAPAYAVELPRFGSRANDEHVVLHVVPEPQMGVAVQDHHDNEVNGIEESEIKNIMPWESMTIREHHQACNISTNIRYKQKFQFIPHQQCLVAVAPGNELHQHPDYQEPESNVHGKRKQKKQQPGAQSFQSTFDYSQFAHCVSFRDLCLWYTYDCPNA